MSLANLNLANFNWVYAFLILLAAFLLFFMLRHWWRKNKLRLAQIDREDLEKFDKNYRPRRLKEIKEEYPGLEEAFIWLDGMLMLNREEKEIRVRLLQEWCCEDRTGEKQAPLAVRPAEIRFAVGDPEQDGAEECCHIDGFLEDDYLTADDIRILNWGLVERCKLFVPFRIYELRTDRVTRRFTAPECVQVNWLDPVAVKEDYTIFIRDEKR